MNMELNSPYKMKMPIKSPNKTRRSLKWANNKGSKLSNTHEYELNSNKQMRRYTGNTRRSPYSVRGEQLWKGALEGRVPQYNSLRSFHKKGKNLENEVAEDTINIKDLVIENAFLKKAFSEVLAENTALYREIEELKRR